MALPPDTAAVATASLMIATTNLPDVVIAAAALLTLVTIVLRNRPRR